MRFRELLESVGKYRPMFNMFAHDGKTPPWVDEAIGNFEGIFKREDRVVWALRWYRVWQASEFHVYEDESAWRRVTKGLPNLDSDSLRFHADALMHDLEAFKHFFSLPVAKIERFVFGAQTPAQIIEAFTEIENEWQASRRQIVNHKLAYSKEDSEEDTEDTEDLEDEDEDGDYEGSNYPYTEYNSWSGKSKRKNPIHGDPYIMLDFHNGWAWWDLNRAFCNTEGGAMGHCGNSASPGEDDHVLSLRRHMGGDEYRPSCTFILNKNGYLGEMKGRANEKPKAEYHDMIIALLMDPSVKGVVGGGYQASLNFSVLDLPEEMRNIVIEKKPSLLSPRESEQVFDQALSDSANVEQALASFEKRMRDYLDVYHLKFKSMQIIDGRAYAILSEYSNVESTNSGAVDMLEEFFKIENLIPAFQKIDNELSDDEAEALAVEARAMNFPPAAKLCLEELADSDFELEGVGYKVMDDGSVLLCIPAHNLANPVGRNDPDHYYNDDPDRERFVLDRISSLTADIDSEQGHGDATDVIKQIDADPADFEDYDAVMAVITFVITFSQKTKVAAEEAVFDSVRDPERTVFSRDPRQLNLFNDPQ